jgi:hypothetical protein
MAKYVCFYYVIVEKTLQQHFVQAKHNNECMYDLLRIAQQKC